MQALSLNLDLFALIILLGVAQGLFLDVFFLTGTRRANAANRCQGVDRPRPGTEEYGAENSLSILRIFYGE